MTKKEFIALADAIREHNRIAVRHNSSGYTVVTDDQLGMLARFCKQQNSQFNHERWLGYIAGTNGPSGGAR